MIAPKVVEVLNGYLGAVLIRTKSGPTLHSWTVVEWEILGGGSISIDGAETADYNIYRRQGDQWDCVAPDGEVMRVSEEIGRHLNLAEQAAASYIAVGPVQ